MVGTNIGTATMTTSLVVLSSFPRQIVPAI
jgi:hypothetical protein